MGKDRAIKTEQEFIGTFINESIGLHILGLNNEIQDCATHEVIMQDTKNNLLALIDGLKADAKNHLTDGQIREITGVLHENLDHYIEKLDQNILDVTNKALKKDGKTDADDLTKVRYLLESGEKTEFYKAGTALKENNAEKATKWEKAANLMERVGLKKLANYFTAKHKIAKLQGLVKTAIKNPKKIRSSIAKDTGEKTFLKNQSKPASMHR